MTDTDARIETDADEPDGPDHAYQDDNEDINDTDDTDDDTGADDFLYALFAPSWVDKLAGARKALIAGGGVVLQGGAIAGLEGTLLMWVQGALAALTAGAVYRVRNVDPDPMWVASALPAAAERREDDEPMDTPQADYVPEHAEGRPQHEKHEHHAEHAAPDG